MDHKIKTLIPSTDKGEGKRGKALGVRQLSRLQNSILVFLFQKHLVDRVEMEGKEREDFYSKGVKWSTKEFYQSFPTNSEKAALSRALKRLAKRGLVVLYDTARGRGSKPRTTHVRLTEYAENATVLNWAANHSDARELIEEAFDDYKAMPSLTPEENGNFEIIKIILEIWQENDKMSDGSY